MCWGREQSATLSLRLSRLTCVTAWGRKVSDEVVRLAQSALCVEPTSVPTTYGRARRLVEPFGSIETSASIVIVHTDPGYAPNPGHAGTGTEVAVLCP